MTQANLSLTLPVAWIARLHQISETQGVTLSALLEEAIAQAFDLHNKGQGERLDRLEQRLLQLDQRLQRLELLRTLPSPIAHSPIPPAVETEDWEDGDEPDEILYDFLPPEER